MGGASRRTAQQRLAARRAHLEATYGLSLDDYAALLAAQAGACAICRGRRRYALHVDHSHVTGLVRGLLCKLCNRRLLPAASDSPTVLAAAIDYLTDPPAAKVLGARRVPHR